MGQIMRIRLSKFAARSFKVIGPSALALGLTVTSGNALTITDTFLSSITGSGNVATIESVIHAASNAIGSLFSNPVTVNILFGTSSGVGGGQSDNALLAGSYSAYTSLLAANSSANPANSILSTAVSHLGSGNDSNGAKPILSTTANLRALGVATTGYFDATGGFHSGGGQPFDGVITLNPTYATTVSVIQHEIDEVLGGGGAGSTLGTSFGANYFGGLDLYRYSAGAPSFNTNASTNAYFSVDGGATSIAGFNQAGGGSDYGDFSGPNNPSPSNYGSCLIQSAYICSGPDTFSITSPEYAMLESLGYDPIATTPLPSTWLMLLSGFAGFGFLAFRGTKQRVAAVAAA